MSNEHIRMANTAHGDYALLCLHCGVYYVPALPMSLPMFEQVCKQFMKEHRRCLRPVDYDPDRQAVELLRFADVRGLVNRGL